MTRYTPSGHRTYISFNINLHGPLEQSVNIDDINTVLSRTNRILSFDTTYAALKTIRPTILVLFRVCWLQRESVYWAVT
jgi:hypothetical protein